VTADRYRSFAELRKCEREGVDYRIVAHDRRSPVAIIAPHGGYIEPPTSRLAHALAADAFNLYCFEGVEKDRDHHELHITSHNFDEPVGCGIVARSSVVVARHGRLDRHDPQSVWLGGLDTALRDRIAVGLRRAGFQALTEGHMFPADQAANICNKGCLGKGVQLELPRGLRDGLAKNPELFGRFVQTMRAELFAQAGL
jgi:phage replication-related protein YjqB (UPF0714/DUF867 family)